MQLDVSGRWMGVTRTCAHINVRPRQRSCVWAYAMHFLRGCVHFVFRVSSYYSLRKPVWDLGDLDVETYKFYLPSWWGYHSLLLSESPPTPGCRAPGPETRGIEVKRLANELYCTSRIVSEALQTPIAKAELVSLAGTKTWNSTYYTL